MLRKSVSALGRLWPCLFAAMLIAPSSGAQDTRTVSEPAFPEVCATLTAQLQQTGNMLPAADESSFDTARVQDALNACASGQAVELAPGAAGDNAFLIQPITLPSGVTLLVDAGVTVYGSRNPNDYAVASASCGIVASSSQGCTALITLNSSNSGIMGYGTIDGRGGQTLTAGSNAGATWWQLAYQAQQQNLNQYNPPLVKINGNNITLYKITLQNSPSFHVLEQGSGFTVWDVKIIAPGDARNTDGIDPGPAQNVTIENSYIGDGDDNICLKPSENPGGGAATNMSILNNHFYVGHGMSIGSQTAGGASNILVQNLNIDGDPANSNDIGIRIKSESSNGGIVSHVTYENVCMQNVASPLQFNPFYDSSTGSDYPQFQNITLSGVTVLTAGKVLLEGYSSTYPLGLTLDNVNLASLDANEVSAENANIAIGPGPTNLSAYLAGSDVTVASNVSNPGEAQYSCPASSFPLLAPEWFGSASQAAPAQALTLTAILEPVREPNWESTAGQYASTSAYNPVEPTGTVAFYDGSALVGQATLTGSSDLASLTLSSETPGAHSYTAVYSGDSNYAGLTTAAFPVMVGLFSTSTGLAASATTLNAGQSVTLTASVTSSGATPAGTVTFMDGATTLGSVALNNSGTAAYTTSSLAAGSHSITALFAATGNFAASSSAAVTVNVQSFTMAASSTSLNIAAGGSASTTLTFTGAGGLGGTISAACGGLPAYMSCSFSPASASFSGNTASMVLTVSVAATLSGWLFPLLPLLALAPRRSRGARGRAVLMALLAAAAAAGISACGSGGAVGSSAPQAPPAGQQTVVVTASVTTPAGVLTNTEQVTVNVE